MSYFQPRNASSRVLQAAFSLVELLVTIGIIFFLASLLGASIMRVQESAHSAGCLNNLRTIGIAFRTFASDNNQACMPAYVGSFESLEIIQRYPFTGYWNSPIPEGTSNLGDSKTAAKITHCPASKKSNPTYTANYNVMRASNQPWRSILSIKNMSKTMLMTDSSVTSWGPGFNNLTAGQGFNRVADETHGGKINILWADGHVTTEKKSDITVENLAIQE